MLKEDMNKNQTRKNGTDQWSLLPVLEAYFLVASIRFSGIGGSIPLLQFCSWSLIELHWWLQQFEAPNFFFSFFPFPWPPFLSSFHPSQTAWEPEGCSLGAHYQARHLLTPKINRETHTKTRSSGSKLWIMYQSASLNELIVGNHYNFSFFLLF